MPEAARPHAREDASADAPDAEDVCLELLPQIVVANLLDRALYPVPGVVDDDLDRSGRGQRRVHRRGIADVQRQRLEALGGKICEVGHVARRGDHMRIAGGERARCRPADACRAPRHQAAGARQIKQPRRPYRTGQMSGSRSEAIGAEEACQATRGARTRLRSPVATPRPGSIYAASPGRQRYQPPEQAHCRDPCGCTIAARVAEELHDRSAKRWFCDRSREARTGNRKRKETM